MCVCHIVDRLWTMHFYMRLGTRGVRELLEIGLLLGVTRWMYQQKLLHFVFDSAFYYLSA